MQNPRFYVYAPPQVGGRTQAQAPSFVRQSLKRKHSPALEGQAPYYNEPYALEPDYKRPKYGSAEPTRTPTPFFCPLCYHFFQSSGLRERHTDNSACQKNRARYSIEAPSEPVDTRALGKEIRQNRLDHLREQFFALRDKKGKAPQEAKGLRRLQEQAAREQAAKEQAQKRKAAGAPVAGPEVIDLTGEDDARASPARATALHLPHPPYRSSLRDCFQAVPYDFQYPSRASSPASSSHLLPASRNPSPHPNAFPPHLADASAVFPPPMFFSSSPLGEGATSRGQGLACSRSGTPVSTPLSFSGESGTSISPAADNDLLDPDAGLLPPSLATASASASVPGFESSPLRTSSSLPSDADAGGILGWGVCEFVPALFCDDAYCAGMRARIDSEVDMGFGLRGFERVNGLVASVRG